LLLLLRRPRPSRLFPYTTLFRSSQFAPSNILRKNRVDVFAIQPPKPWRNAAATATQIHNVAVVSGEEFVASIPRKCNCHVLACQDRKSTRLNSSHGSIPYAVS